MSDMFEDFFKQHEGSIRLAAETQHRARVETLWTKLAAIAVGVGAADRVDSLKAEVERRQEMFAKIRRESPRSGEHADAAALRSVISDLECGYLS